MAATLLARLFVDAQQEFLRAVDHIPEPGRHGALGRLSPPGRVVAHLAFSQDAWIHRCSAGRDHDPWALDWATRQRAAGYEDPLAPPLDEARAAFERIAQSAAAWVTDASREVLLGPADLSGTPYLSTPTARAYMVARGIAHTFAHVGELSVIASMVRAGDLGFPGPLPRSSEPSEDGDWTVPVMAALLQDAYVELGRVAAVVPQPAAHGASDRFNPVSLTLVHVLAREDAFWSQAVGHHAAHPWMSEAAELMRRGEPLPWDACLEMAAEVTHAASSWLQTVTPEDGGRPLTWGSRESTVAPQLARSVGHVFAHASEMLAVSSLYGVGDLDLPGDLEFTRAATSLRAG